MIEPLDFSKYVIQEFPHFSGTDEDKANWHKDSESIEAEFRADLVVYLMDYLLIELDEDSIYLPKIKKLVDIAMGWDEDWTKTVELAVRMLPLIMEDKFNG